MADARTLFGNLTPRGRLTLAGSVLGVLVVGFLLFHFATQPSYQLYMTGLDPAQTGKITATLDAKGIGYELRNNGTALAIDETKAAQAQIALAEAGLNGSGQQHPGFDLVMKQKLGTSQFQQQVAYQQALEGSLASTIEQIQGISSAQVQLVLPDPTQQLFSQSAAPATAAVLLGGSDSIDPAAVRGIAQLVASSVQGLRPANVTITDSTGQALWPPAGGVDGGDGAAGVLGTQARYDQQVGAQVDALLAQTLGPGKAHVEVNATLNLDKATQDKLQYAKKGVPLQTHSETETLTGKGASAGGAAGAAGNLPQYSGATGGGNSSYKHKITDQTLGVDRTVTHTTIAPGQVTRQSVAVMVDAAVPKAQLAGIQKTVSNAVGLLPSRGDAISLTQMPFAKPPKAAAPGLMANPMSLGKYVLIGLGCLLFLFFARRSIRRGERRPLGGEPVWLREIEAPRPLAEVAAQSAAAAAPTQVLDVRPTQNGARRHIDGLLEREPERVAAQVRSWMQEE
jgi:flagellar M-ring protein FliF